MTPDDGLIPDDGDIGGGALIRLALAGYPRSWRVDGRRAEIADLLVADGRPGVRELANVASHGWLIRAGLLLPAAVRLRMGLLSLLVLAAVAPFLLVFGEWQPFATVPNDPPVPTIGPFFTPGGYWYVELIATVAVALLGFRRVTRWAAVIGTVLAVPVLLGPMMAAVTRPSLLVIAALPMLSLGVGVGAKEVSRTAAGRRWQWFGACVVTMFGAGWTFWTNTDPSFDDRLSFYWSFGGLSHLAWWLPVGLAAATVASVLVFRRDLYWSPAVAITSLPVAILAARNLPSHEVWWLTVIGGAWVVLLVIMHIVRPRIVSSRSSPCVTDGTAP